MNEFLEYDGTGNRFDWILAEAKRLRNIRQHNVNQGLMIKNLARQEDRLLWAAVDKHIRDTEEAKKSPRGRRSTPRDEK